MPWELILLSAQVLTSSAVHCMGTEVFCKVAPTDKVRAVPKFAIEVRLLAECYQGSMAGQLQQLLKGSIQARSAFAGAERGSQDSSR